MLGLLPMALLFAVSSGLKAVQFGETRSAETLIPFSPSSTPPSSSIAPTSYDPELTENDYIQREDPLPESIEDDQTMVEHLELTDGGLPKRRFRMDDHFHNKVGDDWGLYVPIELEGEKTVVRRAEGLEKRGQARGTIQFDCKLAPQVCRNAGFYQNCIRGAKGDYKKVIYTNGPTEDSRVVGTPQADENRYNSGVSTTWSTPCRAWPFAQRFWHPQDLPKAPIPKIGLQTDEWPMAIMETGDFGTVPPVSLRCMTHKENTAGARQVTNFRRPSGDTYKTGGKWEQFRLGGTGELALGDTYFVKFNFDSFPKPGATDYKEWRDIRDNLKYAEWTKDADCKNDGLQFHMSALRPSDGGGWSGKLGSPYDSKVHNAYRLSNEQKDIEQYRVTLFITGKRQDRVDADVSYQNGGQWKNLVKQTQQVQPGKSFTLKGKLPKQLKITRMTSGCDYEFVYSADPDLAVFAFNTRTIAYGEAKHNKDPKPNTQELYCDKTTSSSGGITFSCTFPGW